LPRARLLHPGAPLLSFDLRSQGPFPVGPRTRTSPRRVAADTIRSPQSRGKTRALLAVRKMHSLRLMKLHLAFPWLFCAACAVVQPTSKPDLGTDAAHREGLATKGQVEAAKPKLAQPVSIWKDGKVTGELDLAQPRAAGEIVLDLGEEWVPYIFTERTSGTEQALP